MYLVTLPMSEISEQLPRFVTVFIPDRFWSHSTKVTDGVSILSYDVYHFEERKAQSNGCKPVSNGTYVPVKVVYAETYCVYQPFPDVTRMTVRELLDYPSYNERIIAIFKEHRHQEEYEFPWVYEEKAECNTESA